MMNATLTRTVSSFHETPAPQDIFATAPMQAIWCEPDRQREEEAYTSFEAAISDRVLALKERYRRAYTETDSRHNVTPAKDSFVSTAFTTWHKLHSWRIGQRGLLLVGAALMFLLVGFDLMGLLVLYIR